VGRLKPNLKESNPMRILSRRALSRTVASLAVLAASASAVSCGGGGGGGAAKPMVLVELLFVDRALVPQFQTGVLDLPRNAQLVFKFSELVDPTSVDEQSIAIRFGSQFQTVPKGAFKVDSDRVIFDPTITSQGVPNPRGFEAGRQFNVELPSIDDQPAIPGATVPTVRNLDNDPLLASFFTSFTTSDEFLRELVPPQVLSVDFTPSPDPLTRQIPGDGIMTITFSEAMDPASFVLSTGPTVIQTDTIDIRYRDLSPNPNSNTLGQPAAPTPTGVFGNELVPIVGSFTHDPSMTKWFFKPTFSFGDRKFDFAVSLRQGLKDLAGNFLVNPRSFGPYVCDGEGRPTGRILAESFDGTTDNDANVTTGDWGTTVAGQLDGAAITTRRVFIQSDTALANYGGGQLFAIVDPLIGALLNQFIVGINPPTNQGRRVMWSFDDTELGQDGTITVISWGPDSNATFAALYPDVILRLGFQKDASMSLATTFSGNYLGAPLIAYKGPYSVSQVANVGNEGPTSANYPFTGYANWPTLTSFFDWDEGDPSAADSVLIVDASVQEGDTWQQLRGYFGVAPGGFPLISGVPGRRMYTTYEEETPNPPSSFVAGILNPEPSLTDTAFTLTRLASVAQSRFYTPDSVDPAGNAYPAPFSGQRTFGVKSDYLDPIIEPTIQTGGATVLVEFYGATALDPLGARAQPNLAFPVRDWTTNIHDCDGFPYIRWRLSLRANLSTSSIAKVRSVWVPLVLFP
jgi:hypothetical protein